MVCLPSAFIDLSLNPFPGEGDGCLNLFFKRPQDRSFTSLIPNPPFQYSVRFSHSALIPGYPFLIFRAHSNPSIKIPQTFLILCAVAGQLLYLYMQYASCIRLPLLCPPCPTNERNLFIIADGGHLFRSRNSDVQSCRPLGVAALPSFHTRLSETPPRSFLPPLITLRQLR